MGTKPPPGWTAPAIGAAILFAFTGCRERASERPVSSAPVAQHAVPGFRDVAREVGIDFRMNFLPTEQGATFKINLYDHGCGLAAGDYDGDGHDDLYFLNQLGSNALYHNRGDGTFENVTEQYGVGLDDRICVGATFADYDNDGDQDLFVTSTRGGNVLFRNDGGKAFRDVTGEAGVTHVGHSQTPVFFDYDNDSWLDLYVTQTAQWTASYDPELRYYAGAGGDLGGVAYSPKEFNVLYRNNGNGAFTDVTEQAQMKGRGWSGDAAVFDYNDDGRLDVLVTSMFGRAQLYRNRGDGAFEDVTLDVLGKTPFGGIGVNVFDFNNDGKLDVYISDMHSDMWMGLEFNHRSQAKAVLSEKVRFSYFYGPMVDESPEFLEKDKEFLEFLGCDYEEVVFGNAFYENLGEGKFREISQSNNTETFWPWGIATGDFDNDSWEDAFLPTGMGYPFYYWHNSLLMNDRGRKFMERSRELGVEPPRGGELLEEMINGRPCVRSSRCAVTGDFNGDGRLEIVVNNFNHEPYFFRNDLPQQAFVSFRLQGTRSNRDAVGAVLRVVQKDRTLTRHVKSAGGYLSHSSKILHFGLGDQPQIERVEIQWPSGSRQVLDNVAANQLHDVIEPDQPAAKGPG